MNLRMKNIIISELIRIAIKELSSRSNHRVSHLKYESIS